MPDTVSLHVLRVDQLNAESCSTDSSWPTPCGPVARTTVVCPAVRAAERFTGYENRMDPVIGDVGHVLMPH